MRGILAASAIVGQAASAGAATLEPISATQVRTGAFAGARLRIGFGGGEAGLVRGGIGIGPMRTELSAHGAVRSSFGNGLELGGRADGKPRLTVAGRSMNELKLQADGKGGAPTWALVAGGVALALGVAAALYVDAGDDASD